MFPSARFAGWFMSMSFMSVHYVEHRPVSRSEVFRRSPGACVRISRRRTQDAPGPRAEMILRERCTTKYLVFGASLRQDSWNDKLAALASRVIEGRGGLVDLAAMSPPAA